MVIALFSRPVRRWLIVGSICVASAYFLSRPFGHTSPIVSDQEVTSEQVGGTRTINIPGRDSESRVEQDARGRIDPSDVDPVGKVLESQFIVIRGQVTDEYLNPVRGAVVCFGCSALPDHELERAAQKIITGEAGRFRYEAPLSTVKDSMSVRVTKVGFHPSYEVLSLGDPKPGTVDCRHDVRLKSSAHLTGVVKRASIPAPGIRVDLTPMTGSASLNRVWTDEHGRFHASALMGCAYRITAVDRDGAYGILTDVHSGQGQKLDVGVIDLRPGARIQAKFVYPGGGPVSGLKVFAELQDGEKADRSIRGKESGHAITDKRGILDILGMSSGRYAVSSVSVMDRPGMKLGLVDANPGLPIIEIPYDRVILDISDKSGQALDPAQYTTLWNKVARDGRVSQEAFDSSIRFLVHAPKNQRFLARGSRWQVTVVVEGVKTTKIIHVPFNYGESRVILTIL